MKVAYFLIPLLACCISISFVACTKNGPTWRNHIFVDQDLSNTSNDASLPRSLWNRVTAVLKGKEALASWAGAGGHEEEEAVEAPAPGEHGTGEPGAAEQAKIKGSDPMRMGSLPSVFTPLKVYLIEKNHGILTRGHTKLSFAAGGGEFDLQDYVQPKNGSFYFAVDFMPDVEKVERKVFFLSHAVSRKLSGEVYGAGCDVYFDVSKGFDKAMKGEGFLVNTTDGRHVSALAGTYIFAAAQQGKLYMASLTIKDSKYKKLQCEH